MFDFEPTRIPGLAIVRPRLATDERGRFVKTFHKSTFLAKGFNANFSEIYYSTSRRNVLRGMHFQTPPHDHDKLVYCLSGAVIDVVVDLRVGSPTYSEHVSIELNGERPCGVYLPTGCAHGFLCLSDEATLLYKVTTEYAPRQDGGIHWDSFGFDWGTTDMIISPRDKALPLLQEWNSPFVF